MRVDVTTKERLVALIPQGATPACISSPPPNHSNTRVILRWCVNLVWGSSSSCLRPQPGVVVGVDICPDHVSSFIQDQAHDFLSKYEVTSRKQDKWCNSNSSGFFSWKFLFKIYV